ncbi:shikimate kinase, partial [Streptomyces griseoviridis]
WRELMEARRALYEGVATAVVATDRRTPEEVTQIALEALELKEA